MKGQKRLESAGRKPGSPNKRTILKVEDVLALHDLNPTNELLKLIPMMDLEQKVRTLCFLITYSQPKPTEQAPADSLSELSEQLKDVSTEDLVKALTHKVKTDAE